MKSTFIRFICRVLVASMIVLPLQSQAGLIGTDQAAASATVAGFIDREGMAFQLQLLGISPQAAKERVAALSDAEVARLAGRIDELPAGGIVGLLAVAAVVALIYYLMIVPTQTTEPAKK